MDDSVIIDGESVTLDELINIFKDVKGEKKFNKKLDEKEKMSNH